MAESFGTSRQVILGWPAARSSDTEPVSRLLGGSFEAIGRSSGW